MVDLGLITYLLQRTFLYSVPLVLASIGEVMSERSGVINVGLEGYVLIGAYVGFKVGVLTNNELLSYITAMIAGLLLSLVAAYVNINLKMSQIVSGIAIWFFAYGLTAFDYQLMLSATPSLPALPRSTIIEVPYLHQIPIIGGVFANHPLFYISIFIALFFHFILNYTTLGLYIKASGDSPKILKLRGVDPKRIQFVCVLICGALAGVAGAYTSISYSKTFIPGISAGRGFMCLAIVACASWLPLRSVLISSIFGLVYTLQDMLRAIFIVPVPYQFLLMLPYIVTLLTILRAKTQKAMPRMLGVPLKEE